MENLTSVEYYKECEAIAIEVMKDCESFDDCYDKLFERINDSQWIIYTYYHLQIIAISANNEYGFEQGLISIEKNACFSDICQSVAFWAFLEDCQEQLEESIFDELHTEEEIE